MWVDVLTAVLATIFVTVLTTVVSVVTRLLYNLLSQMEIAGRAHSLDRRWASWSGIFSSMLR